MIRVDLGMMFFKFYDFKILFYDLSFKNVHLSSFLSLLVNIFKRLIVCFLRSRLLSLVGSRV